MDAPNKQHDKHMNGINPALVKRKQRPGSDPKQPSNADYDYRPDFGETGGGVDHNPELNKESIYTTTKPKDKPKGKK